MSKILDHLRSIWTAVKTKNGSVGSHGWDCKYAFSMRYKRENLHLTALILSNNNKTSRPFVIFVLAACQPAQWKPGKRAFRWQCVSQLLSPRRPNFILMSCQPAGKPPSGLSDVATDGRKWHLLQRIHDGFHSRWLSLLFARRSFLRTSPKHGGRK